MLSLPHTLLASLIHFPHFFPSFRTHLFKLSFSYFFISPSLIHSISASFSHSYLSDFLFSHLHSSSLSPFLSPPSARTADSTTGLYSTVVILPAICDSFKMHHCILTCQTTSPVYCCNEGKQKGHKQQQEYHGTINCSRPFSPRAT